MINPLKIEALILGFGGILFLGGFLNFIPLCAGFIAFGACVGLDLHLWIGLALVGLAFIVFTVSVKVS